ncbi:hypothetical protein C8R44DRAFT_827281 [Mycena epipterygia]|nr:hypothetical protein C8R44DRAFT_827281 [Mycena epipterygia]
MFHKRGLRTNLSNWRGIFLSNFIANCPISWLNSLLTPYVAKLRILPNTQVATQQDVQMRDLMSYLAGIKTWVARHKENVYAIKRDQMKGFDYLSPEGIDADALIITTVSFKRADPHLPDDRLKLHVAMTEATDNSYLFARSLKSLRRNTLEMERFQFAYGWLTQWSKTVAYALQVKGSTPAKVIFDSVTNQRGHDVPLIRDELDFLRAKVDNSTARFEELKSMVDAFTFPRFITRSPITLLRKVTSQCLISRCRALLSLQPIKQSDAEELDQRIMRKIHDELGMPFTPNTKILDLPLKFHGLDLPSISRINAGIAIDGLARDLNHHITAYRHMARITMADWTCGINDCEILQDTRVSTPRLYTDYLNVVNFIQDARSMINQDAKLRRMNGRSYYRWIRVLVLEKDIEITHAKGHADELAIPSIMNYEADHYASHSQKYIKMVPTAPLPTFFMDDYTFYSERDGWIESNICSLVSSIMAQNTSDELAIGHHQRMLTSIYEQRPPPEFPYTRAYSAYSALVQLYARSGQLAVADVLNRRGKIDDDRCRFGCEAVEDAHHLFVECDWYKEWRRKAVEEPYPAAGCASTPER